MRSPMQHRCPVILLASAVGLAACGSSTSSSSTPAANVSIVADASTKGFQAYKFSSLDCRPMAIPDMGPEIIGRVRTPFRSAP